MIIGNDKGLFTPALVVREKNTTFYCLSSQSYSALRATSNIFCNIAIISCLWKMKRIRLVACT